MDFAIVEKALQRQVDSAGGRWGVVVEHLETGDRWEWNADDRFLAASVIKLPIMSAVFHAHAEGRLRLHDELELTGQDQVGGSGVLKMFTPGVRLPLRDLLLLMITVSDNTATNLLIDLLGVEYIQACMKQDGMESSALYNKLQTVPVIFNGRNELTAGDVARWLKNLSQGALVSLYACSQMLDILKRQQYQSKIPGKLPDPDPGVNGALPLWQFANKTGMVKEIEHDAGILYLQGASFLIVSLSHRCAEAIPTMQAMGRTIYDAWYGKSGE